MTAEPSLCQIQVPNFMTDGSIMDLAAARPEHINFGEVANGLSKLARFNGRYNASAYSVAQHCVMGADALFHETGDAVLSGYFLLHDAHEYLLGDISRPMALLVELMMLKVMMGRGVARPLIHNAVKEAIDLAKDGVDEAIFAAANIRSIRLMPAYARQVKAMDERMLIVECRYLYGAKAHIPLAQNGLPAPRLVGAMKSWGAMKAEEAYVERLEKYLGIVVERGS